MLLYYHVIDLQTVFQEELGLVETSLEFSCYEMSNEYNVNGV
jgi:hypothetical protein